MMRLVLVLIAVLSFGVPRAQADVALEARVLRLEAQVKALQQSLKAALQTEQVYNIKAASAPPDSCLSSRSTDPSGAKDEVFLGKCRAADDSDSGLRNWKIQPARH